MSPELKYQKDVISWLTDKWDVYLDVCAHFRIPMGCTLGAGPSWEEILQYLTDRGLIAEYEKEQEEKINARH